MTNAVIQTGSVAVAAITLCLAVWRISPAAAILVVLTLVPNLLVFAWQAKLQDREFVPHGEAERRADHAVEQLINQRTATELATLGSAHQVAGLADVRFGRVDQIMDRILVLLARGNLVGGGATAILLGAALFAIVTRGAGGGGIAAGILGVLSGMYATRSAGFATGDLMSIAPKLQAYRALVDSVGEPEPVRIAGPVDSLRVQDLTVSYPGSDRPAVQGVWLEARRGELVAIVGVNGAGKTTLVNAILGVLDHQSGSVQIDGAAVEALPLAARLGHFGHLTQEFGRPEFTVRESVQLGLPDGVASDQQVWAALDAARIGDLVRSHRDGLDTQLGQQFGGVGLSGGQWQRLALARIHLRQAPIWVLDEPTSAIDAEAEREVFAELERTKQHRITLVVSHRAWTLKAMDRIHVIDQGVVVEQGRFDELLAADGVFARIFAEPL